MNPLRLTNLYHLSIVLQISALLSVSACNSTSAGRATEEAYLNVARVTAERSAQAEPESATKSSPPQWITRSEDEIAPGFSLKVKSSNDQAVNGIFQVNETGALRLPYDVVVQVGGLDLAAAEAKVRESYRAYLVNPDISLSVAKREFYVSVKGLVEKPGPVLVDTNTSLDEIIAKAGGLSKSSQQGPSAQYAKVEQMGVSALINLNDYYSGSTTNLPKWQGGEVIFLQSEGSPGVRKANATNGIQVIGHVKSPGEFPYTEGSDFFDYLIRAGGPLVGADLSTVKIIRNHNGERTTLTFNAGSGGSVPQLVQGDTLLIQGDNPETTRSQMQVWGTAAGILGAAAMVAVAAN